MDRFFNIEESCIYAGLFFDPYFILKGGLKLSLNKIYKNILKKSGRFFLKRVFYGKNSNNNFFSVS